MQVGILRVEMRAKHASTYVKCETGEYESRLLKDWRVQLESIINRPIVPLPTHPRSSSRADLAEMEISAKSTTGWRDEQSDTSLRFPMKA